MSDELAGLQLRLAEAPLGDAEEAHGKVDRVEGRANDAKLMQLCVQHVEQVAREADGAQAHEHEDVMPGRNLAQDGVEEEAAVERHPARREREVERAALLYNIEVGEDVRVTRLEHLGAACRTDVAARDIVRIVRQRILYVKSICWRVCGAEVGGV